MSLVEKALKKMQAATPERRSPSAIAEPQPSLLGGFAEPSALSAAAERTSVARMVPSGPVIEIDKIALRAAGLLPPESQDRQIADQYRQIKRPLISACLEKGAKRELAHMIMVTSAMPGDGKTFSSVNLAISMSLERDFTIVLVDGDAAKPHISRLFGVEDKPGLLDALRDRELDLESLILPTDMPGLSILPAGRRGDENATELFASQRMRALAHALGGYDSSRLAIVDSAPLLVTNESRVLAKNMGQIVVVVRAGVTPQQTVLDALSHLEQGSSVGLVLNQSKTAPTACYYGYGDSGRPAEAH